MTEVAGRLPPTPAAAPRADRQAVVGAGLFVGILVFFLTQTRLPAVVAKLPTLDEGASAAGRSAFSRVLDPLAFPPEWRWVAYGVNLWDANAVGMFFAILLGAAAAVALPAVLRRTRLAGSRGPRAAAVGGALGLPLFMCSACSAPVSLGFRRGGAPVETTLGVILGSALFNPVGILAIFTLLPLEMAAARVVFGLAMLLVAVPLIARAVRVPPVAPAAEAWALPGPPARDVSWPAAVRDGVGAWARAAADYALRLVPPMAVASLAVGVVLVLIPPQELSDSVGTGVAIVVAAAAAGTLIQLPTLFEIPLVLGVLALGVGPGAATALLLAAPSVGLVTFAVTRRDLGRAAPALLMLAGFAGATTAGLVVGTL